MSDCNPSPTPYQSSVSLTLDCDTPLVDATLYRQLVGILIYLTHSRPYISFAISTISRFMQNPHENNWTTTRRILIYLQGTLHYGVFYSNMANVLVIQILIEHGMLRIEGIM